MERERLIKQEEERVKAHKEKLAALDKKVNNCPDTP